MRKKRVLIVSNGYFWCSCEPGPSRFFYIANVFTEAGYDTEVLTVNFQHFKKEYRDIETIRAQNYPFKITFIEVSPYKHNVDLKRVLSNRSAAEKFADYIREHHEDYDVVYCSIPSNRIAAKTALVCKEFGIPFIVDVEDLWPEAMSMVLRSRALTMKLLKPLKDDAETAYACASAVVGTSEDYTERAFQNREKNIPYETVYVGCDLDVFDAGVKQYSPEITKPENQYWVTYAGSIATSYDIINIVKAAEILQHKEIKSVRFLILGTGPEKDKLEKEVEERGLKNIAFLGYAEYPMMAAILRKSDLLINSFRKDAPQSIVNKVGDYLAAGKPMVNTLNNAHFRNLVRRYEVGINVEPGNPFLLAENIYSLLKDEQTRIAMGINARHLASSEFDRKYSYSRIPELADRLLKDEEE